MGIVETAVKIDFLSWDDRACVLVAKRLLGLGNTNADSDADAPVVVVTPTREAARLLREQLAILAPQAAFLSPRIIPLSQLEMRDSRCVGSGAELLLWHQWLAERAKELGNLYPHGWEFKSENWLREAKQTVDLLHRLAKEGLDAHSEGWALLAESDSRWAELRELQLLCRERVHAMGLLDATEALRCSVPAGSRIILACVPQLPRSLTLMLEGAACSIDIWVHAPASYASRFDAWGSPTDAWLSPCSAEELGLDRDDWREHYSQAADLWRMAEMSCARAAAINAVNPVPHQLALAICDAEMEPCIEEELSHHGATVYCPRGLSFVSSSWHKLLRELLSVIDALALSGLSPQSDAAHFPAPVLIRLMKWPAMQRFLQAGGDAGTLRDVATMLDELQFSNIPVFESSLRLYLSRMKGGALCANLLKRLVNELQQALQGPVQLLRCLERWILASGSQDAQQAKLDAFFLQQVQQLIPVLSEGGFSYGCRDVLILLQLICESHMTPGLRDSESLDLLGWMELSYSPARELVIIGMHNGIIPENCSTSALLTIATMSQLDLPSDEQRAARDAYLLRSMIAGRGIERCYFYFSLFDGKQNPLSPSSLLFRLCPDSHLASFASHFFDNQDKLPRSAVLKSDESGWRLKSIGLGAGAQLELSELAQLSCEQLGIENPMAGRHFSPSSLREFLQCPLRFWLSKIHRLDSNAVEEDKQNLNSQELGSFLHTVLEQFIRLYPSQAAIVTASKEGLMEEELRRLFDESYERDYGKKALLPQQIQREGMLKRLLAYLSLHRELWQDGWECATDQQGQLMLEYQASWTLGKHTLKIIIDRVDQRRREDGSYEYRVLDYKTGNVESCSKEHLCAVKDVELMAGCFVDKLHPVYMPFGVSKDKACRWKNLQLPLYAAWLRDHFAKSTISVGYIHLARNSEDVKLMLWESPDEKQPLFDPLESELNAPDTETLMDSALACAQDCMDLVSEGRCFVSAEQLNWPIARDYIFNDLIALQAIDKLFTNTTSV